MLAGDIVAPTPCFLFLAPNSHFFRCLAQRTISRLAYSESSATCKKAVLLCSCSLHILGSLDSHVNVWGLRASGTLVVDCSSQMLRYSCLSNAAYRIAERRQNSTSRTLLRCDVIVHTFTHAIYTCLQYPVSVTRLVQSLHVQMRILRQVQNVVSEV